ARLARGLPRDCCAVNVSPLLREMILEAVRIGALDRRVPAQQRLIGVLLDQLRILRTIPLQLPMPTDVRTLKAVEILRADPAQELTLARVATRAGASARTLERLFRAETGMAFRSWLRRMRVLHALRLLASGTPVTSVALEVGYDSTSAFISM